MLDFTSRFNDANYTGIAELVTPNIAVNNPIGSPTVYGVQAFVNALEAWTADYDSFMVEALAPVMLFNAPSVQGNYATMVLLINGLSTNGCQVGINSQVILQFATPYVVSGWQALWDVNAANIRFNASCGSSSSSSYNN